MLVYSRVRIIRVCIRTTGFRRYTRARIPTRQSEFYSYLFIFLFFITRREHALCAYRLLLFSIRLSCWNTGSRRPKRTLWNAISPSRARRTVLNTTDNRYNTHYRGWPIHVVFYFFPYSSLLADRVCCVIARRLSRSKK